MKCGMTYCVNYYFDETNFIITEEGVDSKGMT